MNQDELENTQVVVPPSVLGEMDKSKVFWTIILTGFLTTFIFIFGYWIGQQRATANYFKIMPNTSMDIAPSLGEALPNTNNNTPLPDSLDTLDSIDNANTNQAPPLQEENIPLNGNTALDSLTPQKEEIIPVTPLESISKISSQKTVNNNIDKEISRIKEKGLTPKKIINQKGLIPYLEKGTGLWAVRMVTVKSEDNAKNLKDKLSKMGYKNVNTLKIGVLFRVSALGFQTKEDALAFQKMLKDTLRLTDTLIIKI